MNEDLSTLRDPSSASPLARIGDVLRSRSGHDFPIVNGIPRFVDRENYARDFGSQWNRFPRTQLDSHSELTLSEDRLQRCFGAPLKLLSGKRVLEAGSGAGRFTEILLKHGAFVDSFDFSNAVEANALNNGHSDRLVLVQGDIRKIPFAASSYDAVICLGVIQHTPSPEASIASLWTMVRPGGKLVIDHYRYRLGFVLPTPIGSAESAYRFLTLRLPAKVRARFVDAVTRFWFPLHWKFRDSLLAQRLIRRLSPVHFYYPEIPLASRDAFLEWALLDTHDAQTDVFKHLRTPGAISQILHKLGGEQIDVRIGGNGIEATCVKPANYPLHDSAVRDS